MRQSVFLMFVIIKILSTNIALADNDYPIVLVHGFGGWGRDEMLGLKYWGGGLQTGGERDLQAVLRQNGVQTFTAAVGPVSSNWDRAVELFYQIKGGCIDYGPYHSTHIEYRDGRADLRAHIRKLDGGINADGTRRPRRCWASDAANNPLHDPLALYPAWGEAGSKLHFIGHSQGGQTIRVLLHLLREGSLPDRNADVMLADESVQENPYTGGKDWIASVTTVSTPLDGTTLTDGAQAIPWLQQFVGAVAAVAGADPYSPTLYDLKLDQWQLKRLPNESLFDYLERVKHSSFWAQLNDVSDWDLSPDGALRNNQWLKHHGDVYYFSYATQSSYASLFGWQLPTLGTLWLLNPTTYFLGSHTRDGINQVAIDASWWPNDGVVNTRSMRAPAYAPVRYFDGYPQRGIWNDTGVLKYWDHTDVIGMLCLSCDIRPLYLNHAKLLQAL